MSQTLPRQYFEDVYAAREDPWDFAGSPYEKHKYEETLSILSKHYGNSLEIGCSVGVFTALLAERCDRLLATDISEQALERARRRCAALPNVEFCRRTIPRDYPEGQFDLTVLSEVGYYFSLEDLGLVAERILEHTAPAGQLLLVHWLPAVHDYPLTGDQVHEFFLRRPEWISTRAARQPRYRIDLLAKKNLP